MDGLSKFIKLNFDVDFSNLVKFPERISMFENEKLLEYDFKHANKSFSFAAIVAYLNKLKYEHKTIKRILLNIVLKME